MTGLKIISKEPKIIFHELLIVPSTRSGIEPYFRSWTGPTSLTLYQVRCMAPVHRPDHDGQKPSRSLFRPFDTLRLCNSTECWNFNLATVGIETEMGRPFVELDTYQLDF
jgi:hypothetical protein